MTAFLWGAEDGGLLAGADRLVPWCTLEKAAASRRTPKLEGAAEAEGVGLFAHGGDAEGDVLVERDVQFLGTLEHVFAADGAGEGFVLHALFDGADFQVQDAFGGTNISAGGEKPGELVASEEGVFELGFASDASVIGVGEDGANEFGGIAVFAEDFGAFRGMLTIGRVVIVGPAFVVEVVQERGEGPEVLVGAEFAGIGADAGFDSEHVFA
jgi:hypothetical protein